MAKKISQKVRAMFPCYTELEAPKDLSLEAQLEMYYKINLIREFDTKVRELWMEKHIYGLAHSYVGAEAIAVGACAALRPDDWITSTHRGHGHVIAKGGDVSKMMAELHGKFEGYNRGKGGSMHIADVAHGMLGATGIVGSGMPLAVGAAYASDLKGDGKVAVCFHGDGGTHQGVWHESVNMAAAWSLPVIFLTENNQMAIATRLECVAGECNIHLRSTAYCIPGEIVDGFNPFEVYKAVKVAAEQARRGEGPSIIEARFMRLLGHFVADDQPYRDLSKVEPWWEFEPIKRMRAYFLGQKLVKARDLNAIEQRAKDDIAHAIDYAQKACTEPPAGTLYDDVYAHGEIIY
ncbi:MAG: thiamine pyrophosphate-dependent dehydrogenase E1 component subunit alpha [Desulfobacterales bacterium]|nr:MAG: thiamine pyrophosphate-dependent dehydrogenase E1 component subunit alpha [Desulfobacterales bacterium]